MAVKTALKLLGILAHPDDESLGIGGTLARYAGEVETYLVMATRGEYGWFGDPDLFPGPQPLGEQRERELRAAAKVLGLQEVHFLNYVDGELDRADPVQAISRIAALLRRIRPHVVITFAPDGAYGHPDHIAISQFTTAAIVHSASPAEDDLEAPPHTVSKLYYMAPTAVVTALYQRAFGEISMDVDGQRRSARIWSDWEITTHVDARQHWRTVWEAVNCHQSQISHLEMLASLSEDDHRTVWGSQTFYRAFSLVNGGRAQENDLFAGLR